MQPRQETFVAQGVGKEQDVDLVPFYRLHRRLYSAYWDVFTPSQWEDRKAAIAAERERLRKARSGHCSLRSTRRNAGGA